MMASSVGQCDAHLRFSFTFFQSKTTKTINTKMLLKMLKKHYMCNSDLWKIILSTWLIVAE